jgi:hypothetical protein
MRVESPAELVLTGADAWCATPGVLVWRLGGVEGASLWGPVTVRQVDDAFAAVRCHAQLPRSTPYHMITDLGGVTRIGAGVSERLSRYLAEVLPRVAARVRCHVVVPPPGVIGAGLMQLRTVHRWRIADDLAGALEVAPGGDALLTRVEQLVAAARAAR